MTYQHTDALGSPVAITNSSKTLIERREYEPYGYQTTPTLQDGPNYTGHVADAATGLVYMQQRYYEPRLGVFISVDPITAYSKGGLNFNRYWYGNDNPYRFIDPDGRYICDGSRCKQLDSAIAETNRRVEKMREGPAKEAAQKIMAKVGTNDGKGQVFHTDTSRAGRPAEYNQVTGEITLHIPRGTTERTIGAHAAHEVSHNEDAEIRGRVASTETEFRATETKAFNYEAVISEAFGVKYTPENLSNAIELSVKTDMLQYEQYIKSHQGGN